MFAGGAQNAESRFALICGSMLLTEHHVAVTMHTILVLYGSVARSLTLILMQPHVLIKGCRSSAAG